LADTFVRAIPNPRQFMNACSPMAVGPTEFGMNTEVRLEHFAQRKLPRELTESGIRSVVRVRHPLSAELWITTTESGMCIVTTLGTHELNENCGITVTESGIVTWPVAFGVAMHPPFTTATRLKRSCSIIP